MPSLVELMPNVWSPTMQQPVNATVASSPTRTQLQDVLNAHKIPIAQEVKLVRTTHASPSALRIQTALTPRPATPPLVIVNM